VGVRIKITTGLGESVNSFVFLEGACVEDDFIAEREIEFFSSFGFGGEAEVFLGGGVGSED
jgi:hypothetical protein